MSTGLPPRRAPHLTSAPAPGSLGSALVGGIAYRKQGRGELLDRRPALGPGSLEQSRAGGFGIAAGPRDPGTGIVPPRDGSDPRRGNRTGASALRGTGGARERGVRRRANQAAIARPNGSRVGVAGGGSEPARRC